MAIIGALLMYSLGIFSDLITDFFPFFKPLLLSYWDISSTHGWYIGFCNGLGLVRCHANLSVVFFYLSSGTLGTVLNIDSLNQVYSLLWGLLALYSYISLSGYRKFMLWLLCALLSVFAKESGYIWVVCPPFIVWSIGKERFNDVIKHLLCCLPCVCSSILLAVSY